MTPRNTNPVPVAEVVRLHNLWLNCRLDGRRADLRGVDLRNAKLRNVNLQYADLRDADLRGADLRGADLQYAVMQGAKLQKALLPNGRTYEQFLAAVPALLAAGGRPLADVATPEHWACHNWSNCPLHAAFGASQIVEVPKRWRARAELFLALFDNDLIPLSQVTS
jgi:hypothetical protein